jgi:hypothetical protein
MYHVMGIFYCNYKNRFHFLISIPSKFNRNYLVHTNLLFSSVFVWLAGLVKFRIYSLLATKRISILV